MSIFKKCGQNGYPYEGHEISGVINIELDYDIDTIKISGFETAWYDDEMRKTEIQFFKQLIRYSGSIEFVSRLPLRNDDSYDAYEKYWSQKHPLSGKIVNFRGAKNTFKPTNKHLPVIGLISRNNSAFFALEEEKNTTYGNFLLSNDGFDCLHEEMSKRQKIAHSESKTPQPIPMEFNGTFIYGSRDFTIPAEDHKKNGIAIRSLQFFRNF